MKLTDYLSDLPHVSDVRPCRVGIGRGDAEAAFYKQTGHFDGAPYVREGLYVLGNLPACYVRSRRTVFRLPDEFGDARDWFVATYGTSALMLNPAFAAQHPCGAFYILMPWTAREAIDAHELTPYARVSIDVLLDEPADIGES